MITRHRFLHTYDGVTSFAIVGVALQPSPAWSVQWNDSVPRYNEFDTAVEEGVRNAAREHERQEGEPHIVQIMELVETLADTRADAVRCAAAIATWKALGHSESDANVLFEGGQWQVTFPSS